MSDIILSVENISKQYRLGLVGTGTLTHDLNRFWHRLRGKEDPYLQVGAVNDRSSEVSSEYVWALKDINFEVRQGEILGIIGKNGAGKSTLLKILSQVTSPTTGSIKTKGRIASLLEVGTGMHPELTGKENIYLNGAILGMSKAEIKEKIEEIVAFSGCQMYIDTPVKRYSSGMRVRLGFAVAAFLEPDILVVDEVLAVGDAEFQKKAIGKMQDISKGGGRTVLFVSHNMASIEQLCDRVIVLKNGSVQNDTNDVQKGIQYYLEQQRDLITTDLALREDRVGSGEVKVCSVKVLNEKKEIISTVRTGQTIYFHFDCKQYSGTLSNLSMSFTISTLNGSFLSLFESQISTKEELNTGFSSFTMKCKVENFPFVESQYTCNVALKSSGVIIDWIEQAFILDVVSGDFFLTGRTMSPSHIGVLINQTWTVENKNQKIELTD